MGSRYDWASAVVFFDKRDGERIMLKVCISGTDEYDCRTPLDAPQVHVPGSWTSHILIEYARKGHRPHGTPHVLQFVELADLR